MGFTRLDRNRDRLADVVVDVMMTGEALRDSKVGLESVERECTPKLLNSPFPKHARGLNVDDEEEEEEGGGMC